MRTLAIICGLILLAACQEPPKGPEVLTVDPSTERQVAGGAIVGGTSATGAHVWRGIPFAASTGGENRWRAPRPAAAWEGKREALEFADRCPQFSNYLDAAQGNEPGTLRGSEDCLYLNVYAPPLSADATRDTDLPVMVWIHGGGNTWGSARQFDGGTLAAKENVIVVTVPYRLGALGWFAHASIRASADPTIPDDLSANFGTLDLIASLEWVRDNIAAFGGDAGRVTIFGESAGGHNVASLIASPRAAGLFHRAIVQSGSWRSVTLEEAEVTGGGGMVADASGPIVDSLLAAVTLPADDPGAVAAHLRGLPLEAIMAPYNRGNGDQRPPRIIADGVTLPIDGIEAAIAAQGGVNPVPIITGTNLHETKLFNALNPQYTDRYLGVIVWPKDQEMYDAIGDYQSLAWRIRSVDEPLTALAAAGHRGLYAYRFDWDNMGSFLLTDYSTLIGAGHAIEIPFVFGNWTLLGRLDPVVFNDSNAEGRVALSDAMMRYWAEFARTGTPGSGITDAAWTAWGDGDGTKRIMILDEPSGGGQRMDTEIETRESLLVAITADERLKDDAARCTVFNAVTGWNPEFENLRSGFLGGGCAANPS